MAEKKRPKNHSWNHNEVAALTDVGFNTSCVDYKRHDMRAAAMQAIIESKDRRPKTHFPVFMFLFLFCYLIVSRRMLTLKIRTSGGSRQK